MLGEKLLSEVASGDGDGSGVEIAVWSLTYYACQLKSLGYSKTALS